MLSQEVAAVKWMLVLLWGLGWPALACGLRVLTEDLPPYQVVKADQVVGGIAYLQVQAILRQAGLQCKSEVQPWARAFDIARAQPNVLIYSLARLPAREADFVWLTPLMRLDYRFYSATREVIQQLSQGKAPQEFVAVAVAGSMMDTLLQQLGFVPEQNLILVKDINAQWKILQLQRAQLTLAFEPDFAALADPQVRQTRFYPSERVVHQIDLYLAASQQTDPLLLQQLQQAIRALQAQGAKQPRVAQR